MNHQSQPPSQSQHATGVCTVCLGEFKLQKHDGTLYKHGHGGGKPPCAGSHKPPYDIKTTQHTDASRTDVDNVSVDRVGISGVARRPIDTDVDTDDLLRHPQWVATMSRIPKSVRAACATTFTSLLQKVIAQPDNARAWKNLLSFAPSILAKPTRGGANRNMGNVVTNRLAGRQPDSASTPSTRTHHIQRPSRSGDTARIAAARRKLEAGNFRAAIRIICSDDAPATPSAETLQALRDKHPPAPADRRPAPADINNSRFTPLQVSQEDVLKILSTFPAGSSGGPDGLTAQHLKDFLSGAPDLSLASALTDLVNILLTGELPLNIREVIFGARLIALQKKGGGIRPIAVGYTLRRLAAKCANAHVIKKRSDELKPKQIGVGVAGGAEAAVHAARRLLHRLPDDHVFVKLDFSNAFNSVRRDVILESAANKLPELYRFINASLSCSPALTFGDETVASAEGAQQGDPLGSLEYCEATQDLLLSTVSEFAFGYIDDINLAGRADRVAQDVQAIIDSSSTTGLHLNQDKCQISANNLDMIDGWPIFGRFERIRKSDLTLLGSPISAGPSVESALQEKVATLNRAIERLSLLPAHDALCLLRNSIAMPKLLYLLRTSPCVGQPLLEQFDSVLRSGISTILNIDLTDAQWLQASLPVHRGGLGVRSARMLAPSAFLASAASTLPLQDAILATSIHAPVDEDDALATALQSWHTITDSDEPSDSGRGIQRAWDTRPVDTAYQHLLATQTEPVDQARLQAASAPHSGDWLYAAPLTAVGLHLSNEEIRYAAALRLGAVACQPHTCECGSVVDARGLHGLTCKKGSGRHFRHSLMNDLIWRALRRAQIPAAKEPAGLAATNRKRPDGTTLIPWMRGRPLAWDVTVADTYASSHLVRTSSSAGAAAEVAAISKKDKYDWLRTTHHFVPVAVETGGAWCSEAVEFVTELGRRITEITGDPLETTYLFQRLSMAVQRGNAACFQNTFQSHLINFSPAAP